MRKKADFIPVSSPHGPSFRAAAFRWALGLAVLLLLPGLTACGDNIFDFKWQASPDTVLLYSLARPELNLLSAFDFIHRVPVQIESPTATGEWDMAIDTQDGDIVFLPPGAVGVTNSKARIIPMGPMGFDEVRRAPSDTSLYVGDTAVPVGLGNIYVIRTRQAVDIYGRACVYYGKLEPLSKDPVVGTVRFVYDVSPVCNSRKLYPPKN
jgi:hypothetical protein